MEDEAGKVFVQDSQGKTELLRTADKCDKYDYLMAVGCGVIGGVIDIFLVGSPGNSVLEKWSDEQVDKTVKGFAKTVGWTPKDEQKNSVSSAIGFLEKNLK